MALDLTMQITVDAATAKAELRAVEQSVQRVEVANQRSVTWWQKEEQAIDKVTGTVQSHRAELSKVEQAYHKAEAAVSAAQKSSAKLGSTTDETTAALGGMRASTAGVTAGLTEMVGAGGLSVGMIAALGVGVGVAAAALVGFGALIVKSTQHYIEHGRSASGLRDEISRLSETWDSFQLMVGAAVMDGENTPLISFLRLAQQAALELGFRLSGNILLIKELVNSMPGMALNRAILSNSDPGALPDPSKVLGGAHPLGSTFGWAAAGAGAYMPMSGAQAQAIFDREEAERKKALADRLAAAKRRAAEQARVEAGIAALLDHGIGHRSGQLGTLPGMKVDLAQAGFTYADIPRIGHDIGQLGSLPGIPFDLSMLTKGLMQGPTLGGRLLSSIGGNLGRTLEGLLIQGGGAGSALGGSLGGSIFGTLMAKGADGSASGLAKGLTGLLGSKIGGAVGSFLPFGGQILGSLVGKLFGGLFGETQGQKDLKAGNADIDKMKAALTGQYGSAAGAQNAGAMFGVDLAGGWGHQNLKGAEAFKGLLTELAEKQAQFNTSLGGTLGQIQALGGGIPEALRPYLQALEDGKVLTQENIDLIARMGSQGQVDFDKMAEAAKRYGIEENALGQAFKDDKMHKSWQQIIDDVDLLSRGGADMNGVLAGMQDEIQALVQQSIAFGTTIPNNMKPWIQRLIDSGDLLGANHEAITDINSLKFGGDMQTTLDTLNETLKLMIDALGVKLPEAARRGAQAWRDELGGLDMPGGAGRTDYAPTDSGTNYPTASRPATLMAGVRSGGGTAVIQIDGRTIAQAAVPHIPGVVRTYVGR